MVEALVERIKDELADTGTEADDIKVIATGGFSRLILPELPIIGILDENLTLEGLRMAGERLA